MCPPHIIISNKPTPIMFAFVHIQSIINLKTAEKENIFHFPNDSVCDEIFLIGKFQRIRNRLLEEGVVVVIIFRCLIAYSRHTFSIII